MKRFFHMNNVLPGSVGISRMYRALKKLENIPDRTRMGALETEMHEKNPLMKSSRVLSPP